jgi:hypothetical protein
MRRREVGPSRHPKRGEGILSKTRGRREGQGIKVRAGDLAGRREWKAVGGWNALFECASGMIWTPGPVVRCRGWLIIIFSAHPDPKLGL